VARAQLNARASMATRFGCRWLRVAVVAEPEAVVVEITEKADQVFIGVLEDEEILCGDSHRLKISCHRHSHCQK